MKLIDKDRVVAEIEKICAEEKAIFDEQCRGGYKPSPSPAVVCVKMEHLLSFLNTLKEKEVQEEPVIKDLISVAKQYIDSHVFGNEEDKFTRSVLVDMFCSGAKWQKEQMMAKAIDGYVIEDIEEGNGDFLLSADYLPKSMGLKDRQKVKVIVIKGD